MADADDDLDVQVAARFAHLLKPIRDLAENWGVDIANDLEDYLTHLNRTAFTFEGGPKLDFAEAALVIQSSACVYSRKVDFLHTLVYQALEAVRSKKSSHADPDMEAAGAAEGNATQRERVSKRDAAEPEDDTMEGFLSAGLNLKQAEDIDLGMEEAPPAAYVRPPAALLALEDQCSGAGDGDAGFCRLAHCFVHVSGALFLDANDAELYDQLLNNTNIAMPNAWAVPEGVQKAQLQPITQQQKGDGDDDEDDDGGLQGGGDSDDEAGPAVSQLPAAPAGPSQLPAASAAAGAAQDPVAAAAMPAVADTQSQPPVQHAGSHAQADPVQQAAPQVVPGAREEEDEEVFDLYKPLDMDAPGTLPIKPMQVKRPAKGKLKPVVVPQATVGALRPAPRHGPTVTLLNPEFTYGLELLQRMHPMPAPAPRTRTTRGQAAAQAGAAAAAAHGLFDAADAAAAQAELNLAIEEQQQLEAEGMQGMQAGGGDAGGYWDEGGDVGGGGAEDDDGGDAYGAGLDLMGLIEQGMMHPVGARAEGMALDDDYNNTGGAGDEGPSYEDLCRAHIDAMMATAAAQEVQTELAVRVSGWRTKIDPVLRDEEGRKGFDIQQYQQRIIGTLDKPQQDAAAVVAAPAPAGDHPPVPFGAVAAQSIKWEVSRTFAAMLQLINNRNVAIHHQAGGPDAPFCLQLLNPELLHKTMGQRLAGGAGPTAGDAAGEGTDVAMEGPDGMEDDSNTQPEAMAAARRPSKKPRARS